jgi:hypothetical protein
MTELLQSCEVLSPIPAGIGPAVTRASRRAETAWSLVRRRLSDQDTTPTLMEWDNDVPSFSIFTGEVTHAEASLALSPTAKSTRCRRRRNRRHLAA